MSPAARALASLVLLLLVAATAYWAGDHNRDNAWRAKEARVVLDAHEKYEGEVKRGLEAAGRYLDDLSKQETRYVTLENKFEALRKRVPIVVAPAASDGAPAAAAGPQSGRDPPAPLAHGVAAQPELSLAAVWMWNSALAGADVPAGACGADATAEGACAAGAGLTVEDAWRNHAINARTCAADRLRYQRLIDYLAQRQPANH